jgi:hypothetical protein
MYGMAFWVDRIDHASEWSMQEVVHQDAANAARRDTGTHDGDRGGTKEGVERIIAFHADYSKGLADRRQVEMPQVIISE